MVVNVAWWKSVQWDAALRALLWDPLCSSNMWRLAHSVVFFPNQISSHLVLLTRFYVWGLFSLCCAPISFVLHSLAPLKSSICTTGVFFRSAVKCERVPKLLDLVGSKLASSARAAAFYDNMTELVETTVGWKVMSESHGDSVSLTVLGNRCGSRAQAESQHNSERCFTEAIVLHTHTHTHTRMCVTAWL